MTMTHNIRCCYLGICLLLCITSVMSQEKKKTNTALTDFNTIESYQKLITPSLLATHLYYLSSDEMKGRETGSVGQKLAAKYLAAQYRLLGTQPKGTIKNADAFSDSSFFQPFNLFSITPKRSSLEVLVNGQQIVSETFAAEHSNDLFYFGVPAGFAGEYYIWKPMQRNFH